MKDTLGGKNLPAKEFQPRLGLFWVDLAQLALALARIEVRLQLLKSDFKRVLCKFFYLFGDDGRRAVAE